MQAAPPNKVTTLPDEILANFPQNIPFVRMGVFGEGSCFFLSVCAATNHKNFLYEKPAQQKMIGQKFRCDFSKLITDDKWAAFTARNPTSMTADVARRNFCKASTWASQPMIVFVSEILGLNILFIDTEKAKLFCGVRGESTHPMIIILWVNHSHFEPVGICHKMKTSSKTLSLQFVFDPVKDIEIINHIINTYAAQCST